MKPGAGERGGQDTRRRGCGAARSASAAAGSSTASPRPRTRPAGRSAAPMKPRVTGASSCQPASAGLGEAVHQPARPSGRQHRAGDVVFRVAVALLSATIRTASTAAISAIGMLTSRHQRQLAYSVSTPPSSRPTAAPPPAIAPYTPNALARSFASVNSTVSSAREAGREQRAERALQGPGGEQRLAVLGRAAERGGDREAEMPDHERALSAPVVGDAAAEQQQTAEGQGVRGDHPLPVGVADAEVDLGLRQGDVDDGGVQHHHQLRDGDDRQRDQRRGFGCGGVHGRLRCRLFVAAGAVPLRRGSSVSSLLLTIAKV